MVFTVLVPFVKTEVVNVLPVYVLPSTTEEYAVIVAPYTVDAVIFGVTVDLPCTYVEDNKLLPVRVMLLIVGLYAGTFSVKLTVVVPICVPEEL